MSLETLYGTMIAILSAAVVGMWRRMLAEFRECKRDRDFLRRVVAQKIGIPLEPEEPEVTAPESGT